MPTLIKPKGRNHRPIKGTGRLPAWLEPHREKITFFVNFLVNLDVDLSHPNIPKKHIRFRETGVVLVFKGGYDAPQNLDRLDRLQRLKFWEIVRKWAALEKANRDKSKKSGRSNRNDDCVNNRGTTRRSNNSRSRKSRWA